MRRLGSVRNELELSAVTDEEEKNGTDGDPRSLDVEWRKAIMPRRSSHRRSISLVSSLNFVNLRRTFCYERLRQIPLHLKVVKLDGSCFGIEVEQSGRVFELKQAVERAFSHLPRKGPHRISWGQVWGHFCLRYNGCKLLDDEKFIKDYRMRDGDQLYFTHHVSAAYHRMKKKSAKQDIPKLPGIFGKEIAGQQVAEENCGHLEDIKCQRCQDKYETEEKVIKRSSEDEAVVGQLCRKWMSYSKLKQADQKPPPSKTKDEAADGSRLSKGLIGCFKSVFRLYQSSKSGYSSVANRIEI